MKNLLLSTALVALTATAALADGSGFNVGVHGGLVTSSSKHDMKTNNFAPGFNQRSDLGGTGGTFGLSTAYNFVMGNGLVFGMDVFAALHNHDAKQDTTIGTGMLHTKTKMKYSFGTAAKFGYLFDKTLVFGRVGYINSRFEFRSTVTGTTTETKTSKKNISGLLLGVGVDVPLNDKMSVGVSYDFAIYQKKSLKVPLIAANNVYVDNKFKQRMHFMNVALKYKF